MTRIDPYHALHALLTSREQHVLRAALAVAAETYEGHAVQFRKLAESPELDAPGSMITRRGAVGLAEQMELQARDAVALAEKLDDIENDHEEA